MGIRTLLPTLLPSISAWLPLDLIQGHLWRSASGANAIAPLDFWGNKNCTNQFWGLLGMKPQNIPKLFSGIFGDKTPKNPNFQPNPVPKKSPMFFHTMSPSPPRPRKFAGKTGDGGPVSHHYFQCWKFWVYRLKGCKVTSHQTLRMIRPWSESNSGRLFEWGRSQEADFFLRPPTSTASNF